MPDLFPFHTYVDGDAYCTVMMADADQTFDQFARNAVSLVHGYRLAADAHTQLLVTHNGKLMEGGQTVRASGIRPFERLTIQPAPAKG